MYKSHKQFNAFCCLLLKSVLCHCRLWNAVTLDSICISDVGKRKMSDSGAVKRKQLEQQIHLANKVLHLVLLRLVVFMCDILCDYTTGQSLFSHGNLTSRKLYNVYSEVTLLR